MFLNASLRGRGLIYKSGNLQNLKKKQTEISFIFNVLVGLSTIQGNLHNDARIFA